MANTLTTSNTRRTRIGISYHQLAWGVMLFAFAVFCAIVIVIIMSVQYFLFQSRVPIQSTIDVARGTATLIGTDLIEQGVRGSRDVSGASVLTTDTQSQAALSFMDGQDSNRLIATVTMQNGSSLNLVEDSRPRFDLSSDPYWIAFQDAYGEFDILVPDNLDRSILISFGTTLGPSARLSASGRYTVIAAGAQVQVINYSGEALLIAADNRNQNVPAGQTASMQSSTNQFVAAAAPTNLLADRSFSVDNVLDMNTPAAGPVWRCFSTEVDTSETPGAFGISTTDGRPSLLLFRGNGAESHGETDCLQGVGTTTGGYDVSQYGSVSIRAIFKIQSQSLSTCGVDGSECPFTLAMDYVPINGGEPRKWYHGFYAVVDPNRAFPLICNSCSEQHEQINPGVWYTYESSNLKDTFAPDSVPQSIINLRFYSSGHQYEVYVREVELLVGQPLSNGS